MKRFHFKLQSVAVLRSLRELRAREELAAAIRYVEHAIVVLADARARCDLLDEMLRSDRAFTLRAAEHVAFLSAMRDAHGEVSAAEKTLAEAVARRARQLDVYYDAARGVKVLANLEARARAVHARAADHEEQVQLDERAAVGGRNAAFLP